MHNSYLYDSLSSHQYVCMQYPSLSLSVTLSPRQALYDYQPSLLDAQLLLAWLTVMQSAHTKLASLNLDLSLAHLPRLFQCCVSCFLSNKDSVKKMASDVMQVSEFLGSLICLHLMIQFHL